VQDGRQHENSSIAKLRASPASEVNPRQRQKATIAATLSAISQSSGTERWESVTEYARPPGTASGR
jgi:hypothetical protein